MSSSMPAAPLINAAERRALQTKLMAERHRKEKENPTHARMWAGKTGLEEALQEEDDKNIVEPVNAFLHNSSAQSEIKLPSDPRLQRLMKSAQAGLDNAEKASEESNAESSRRRRRRKVAAAVVVLEGQPADESTQKTDSTTAVTSQDTRVTQDNIKIEVQVAADETKPSATGGGDLVVNEEELTKRRRAQREQIRAKMIAKQQELAKAAAAQAAVTPIDEPLATKASIESAEKDEEEDSDEDDEEEGWGEMTFQPVFVKKEDRKTVKELEKIQADAERAEEEQAKRKEQLREEAKQRLAEVLERDSKPNSIVDKQLQTQMLWAEQDKMNEAEEFEMWREREIARIRAELEERRDLLDERTLLERNREEQAGAPDEKPEPKEKKKKGRQFLQKYYHKGAFFIDGGEWDVTKNDRWDFNAPTGEDADVNKEFLPKVLQVRNFGKAGRSKHTHLVDEDTTDKSSPWASKELIGNFNLRMRRTGHGEPLPPRDPATVIAKPPPPPLPPPPKNSAPSVPPPPPPPTKAGRSSKQQHDRTDRQSSSSHRHHHSRSRSRSRSHSRSHSRSQILQSLLHS